MTFNPDVASSIFVSLMAGALAMVDVHTDSKRSTWVTLPKSCRWLMRFSAVLLILRAANLWDLSPRSANIAGHVNWLAMVTSASLALTFISLTLYVRRLAMDNRGWERARHVVEVQRENPEMVPVMVDEADVAAFALVGPTPTDMFATLQRADDHLAEAQHP